MKLILGYHLDDNQTDRELIQNELNSLKHLNPIGIKKTNIGGWHSKDLINNNKFDTLNNTVVDIINNDIFKDKVISGIGNSWCIINSKGHYNTKHNHLSNTISGCYYVKATKNSGDITFFLKNEEKTFKPVTGMLLIFPGVIKHSVDVNETEEDGIVYYFNIKDYNVLGRDEIFFKTLEKWEKNDK